MTGKRKLWVFFGSSAFLLAGMVVSAIWPAVLPAFSPYATGIATAAGIFTLGNGAEHFAKKGQS